MMKASILRRSLAAVLLVTLALSGCASVREDADLLAGRDTSTMTPAQQKLYEFSRESAKIRASAAAAGAVLGAGIGLAACHDKKDATKVLCTLGGLVVGATAGYQGGKYIAQRREEAKAGRDDLEASIRAANASIDNYSERAALARQIADEHSQQIKTMNAQYRNNTALKTRYVQQLRDLKADRAAIAAFSKDLEGDLKFLEDEIASYEGRGENVATLRSKKRALERQNDALQAQLDALDRAFASAPSDVQASV
ncbi:MAG: hypothetical protein MRY63_09580 [Neomegalonema sp.]|nr:hypothetical protein [Neomegalonema sp.]